MLKDYYVILNIDEDATQQEIKIAFRKKALKYHPDINIGVDTTKIMQDINEAYLILKDTEARERYNREYINFKNYRQQQEKNNKEKEQKQSQSNQGEKTENKEKNYEFHDYKINDAILSKWIENATRQAVDLASQTIQEVGELSKVGFTAAGKEIGNYLVMYVILGVVVSVIFLLLRGCTN